MEGSDHGEVLTKFEEIFGTVVEHEVIKMILQSCGWESRSATEMLLAMIDPEDLPSRVRNALIADSIVHNSPKQFSDRMPVDVSSVSRTDSSETSTANSEELKKESINVCNKPISRESTKSESKSLPESLVSGTVPQLSSGSSNTNMGAGINTPTCKSKNQTEIVSPHSSLEGILSGSSSPSISPHRSAFGIDFEVNRERDTSNWVLAPEFAPNDINPNALVNNNGLWHLGMSSNSDQTLQPSSKGNQKIKLNKKDEIVNKILLGAKIMVLMRGLPGSGKSTLAKEMKGRTGVILSTDDFFYNKHGKYDYDPSRIGDAHQWNKHRALQKLQDGKTPIIIDNTNLQAWEMKPYVKLGLQYGYEVDILDTDTPWKLNPKELAKRNSHGVPKNKIFEMKGRYERDVKIEHIIADLRGFPAHTHNKVNKDCASYGIKSQEDGQILFQQNINGGKSSERSLSQICNELMEEGVWSSEDEEDEDDDVDVIIEGYDSDDEKHTDCECASDRKKIDIDLKSVNEIQIVDKLNETKVTDSSKDFGFTTPDIEEIKIVNDETLSHSIENKENVFKNKKLEWADVPDEEKIRILIEEANADVDVAKNETDWLDLTSQVSEEDDVSDQKFSDLVMSFGSIVRAQIKKGTDGINVGAKICTDVIQIEDTLNEDSAMYELCSNVEEKTGKSLSMLVTRLGNNEEGINFLPVNNNQDSHEAQESCADRSLFSFISLSEATSDLMSNMGDKKQNVSGVMKNLEVNIKNDSLVESFNAHDASASNEGVMLGKNFDNHSQMCHNSSSEVDSQKLVLSDKHAEDWKEEIKIDNSIMSLTAEDKISETNITSAEDKITLTTCKTLSQDGKSGEFNIKGVNAAHQDASHNSVVADSLTSWECVDITAGESSLNWDSSEKVKANVSELQCSKPNRTRRKRISGDPAKWLGDTDEKNDTLEDPSISSWNPVQSGIPSWDSNIPTVLSGSENPLKRGTEELKCDTSVKPLPHTGAVPKFRRRRQQTGTRSPASTSSGNSDDQVANNKIDNLLPGIEKNICDVEKSVTLTHIAAETQTQSIDFEALQLDNNLYELKIIYGQPGYITKDDIDISDSGPLTKGKLYLDKGTMTENESDIITVVDSLKNLVAFFPNIPEDDLQDVLEKCKYDLDWAMNVLLDSGYEMSDLSDANITYQEPKEMDIDTESTTETTSTGDGRDDPSSFADASDISSDILVEERSRKFKQSQQPKDLASKKEIECAFNFSNSVDDRITRLTGKDVGNLNMTKVKQMKAKKNRDKENISSNSKKSSGDSTSGDDAEGAQYITLVMDPLFATQLTRMFGPVGSCEISGELTPEDQSVILPLEFCLMIHKYWALTLDGKFKHEAEVLDSLIREDECLARRLQEEEDLESSRNENKHENSDEVFQKDPPTQLQEIMDLEQALQQSQGDKSSDNLTISSRLTLQRLYAEYPHVDPNALREEFTRRGFSYQDTVESLYKQYGAEQGAPKTVIAPEALDRYEQQMIQQAQRNSLVQQEQEDYLATQESEDELIPDDPQVYRNEAQLHYHQRQEAFKKAQEASGQGMKAAAAYYARIGNLHSSKLIEANQRASQKILEATNANRKDANCLDLHLLHVPEALSAAQAFLAERQRVLTARGIRQMQVSLITGRGAHSIGGQAKLKPAIKEFLQKSNFLFHEANSGMFTVTLKS